MKNRVLEKIEGEVKRGMGLGKKLGFPTINLSYSGRTKGIFVGRVYLGEEVFPAAVHVGPRISIPDEKNLVEAHIVSQLAEDVLGEIRPGKIAVIELLHKIRESEKIPDLKALSKKIASDVEFTKKWYKLHLC